MKLFQKKYLNLCSISLLIFYFFAIIPANLYHHHQDEIVSYQQASQCDKVVYYGEESTNCHHKQHISKAYKTCSLCTHFPPTNYKFSSAQFEFLNEDFTALPPKQIDELILPSFISISNRAPPIFS